MTISINGTSGISKIKVYQHTRVFLVSSAASVAWGQSYLPVSPNGAVTINFNTSGSTTSTNLSESIDLTLPGTYVINVAEDGGSLASLYIEAEDPLCSSLIAFPGETVETDASVGWARNTEKSILGAAQKPEAYVGIASAGSFSLGDLVQIRGVGNKLVPGIKYTFTTPGSNTQSIGIITHKISDNNSGYFYIALFKGSIITDPTFTLSTTFNRFYYNAATGALTTVDTDRYVGLFSNTEKVLNIENTIVKKFDNIVRRFSSIDILTALQALGAGNYDDELFIELTELPYGCYCEYIEVKVNSKFYTSDEYGVVTPPVKLTEARLEYGDGTVLIDLPSLSSDLSEFKIDINDVLTNADMTVNLVFTDGGLVTPVNNLNYTVDGLGVPDSVEGDIDIEFKLSNHS